MGSVQRGADTGHAEDSRHRHDTAAAGWCQRCLWHLPHSHQVRLPTLATCQHAYTSSAVHVRCTHGGTHIHMCTHKHAHTHTRTQAGRHARTHTHAHAHLLMQAHRTLELLCACLSTTHACSQHGFRTCTCERMYIHRHLHSHIHWRFDSYFCEAYEQRFEIIFTGLKSGRFLLLLWWQLYLRGSPYLARFLRMWPFCNPIIEVVAFCLSGTCMLGVFMLPAFTRVGHECQDLWVCAMECICAKTRPRFILSS